MAFVITASVDTPASRLANQTDHTMTVTVDADLQSLLDAAAAIRDRAVGAKPASVTVTLSPGTLTASWTVA